MRIIQKKIYLDKSIKMPNSILLITILTLLFLMDITVGLLGFEFTQQYIGAAYFSQKPSIKSATLLAAFLLILINCILFAYHFLGLTYIRFESTFITLVFNYLIINFIVKNMKPDTQKDIII